MSVLSLDLNLERDSYILMYLSDVRNLDKIENYLQLNLVSSLFFNVWLTWINHTLDKYGIYESFLKNTRSSIMRLLVPGWRMEGS